MDQSATAKAASPRNIVIISAYHDFRSKKRASIHHIAEGLTTAGFTVTFISMRFSWLSVALNDSRSYLKSRSNKLDIFEGVRCYLWRTALHPFSSRQKWIERLTGFAFPLYARSKNKWVDRELAQADTVIIESGVAAVLIPRVRQQSPVATIIYYAADRLSTVGAHPFIYKALHDSSAKVNRVVVRSKSMVDDFPWAAGKIFTVGFGVNSSDYSVSSRSPFNSDINAVSVGSMLFDESFFRTAAPLFPDVTFHVIGCGTVFDAPSNVVLYKEMPFKETLRYLQYASFGIAPYRLAPNAEYLADTSLKLAQYAYFGLPALCPDFAVGTHTARVGYSPANPVSIRDGMTKVLSLIGHVKPEPFPSWEIIAKSILFPPPDTE